jgi:hypothetical protein
MRWVNVGGNVRPCQFSLTLFALALVSFVQNSSDTVSNFTSLLGLAPPISHRSPTGSLCLSYEHARYRSGIRKYEQTSWRLQDQWDMTAAPMAGSPPFPRDLENIISIIQSLQLTAVGLKN